MTVLVVNCNTRVGSFSGAACPVIYTTNNIYVWFYLMTNLTHNSFLYMFISILYMFQAFKCSSSGDSVVSVWYLVYVIICRWPSGMQVWTFHPNLHTRQSPTYSNIYQISYWYNWISWWWALECLKHVENWNKHTQKELCVKLVIK